MTNSKILPLALTALILAGAAAPAFAQVAHSVSWYLANQADMNAQLSACGDNPGMMANTPDCINASAAAYDVIRETL